MDSQPSHSDSEDNQLDFGDIVLHHKDDRILTLDHNAQNQIDNLIRSGTQKSLLNGHLDPKSQSRSCNNKFVRQNINFFNFMTKKKNQDKRKQAFQVIRQMLEQKGYENISSINQRQQKSIMVVRFVNKMDQSNMMQIEDDLSKQRQKIVIKQGIVWVGLICAIEAIYENQMYRLQKIIDLSPNIQNPQKIPILLNNSSLKILLAKGPVWKLSDKQNIGIQLLINEIQNLKHKGTRIDIVVLMGPILSQNNQLVKNFNLQKSFEQQFIGIIETFKSRVIKLIPQIQVIVIPSTDDVVTMYPIPQPPFDFNSDNTIRYCSNPCSISLGGLIEECKINFINYDLISYIDSNKTGRSIKETLIQNVETYLKQPFLITNTLEDTPFDETNLSRLFNRGEFGNIIVMSSQIHPPFAIKAKNNSKIFLNIGSLGIDYHREEKHFIVLMSLFEGQGDLSERVKIQSIIM